MSHVIAPAEASHLLDIAYLFATTRSPPGDPALVARELHDERTRPQTRLWIALADAEGAGAAIAGALLAWQVADELTILDVAVPLEHRRRGFGRALVVEALRAARAEGGQLALLEVRAGNAPARELYRSVGFEDVRVRRGYYADGEDGVEMHAPLG
ncbi:MAG TPA: GNAT family N-acetyltransferase [Polyangiaceae bacterium]|nr:GNAT family N-acetyltransferase [Polyangiaceae bacterium]